MQLTKGMIVKSMAGHDKDRFYVVLDLREGDAWIADGKRRKLEHPTRKNGKHLSLTKTVIPVDEIKSNRQLRKLLWPMNEFGQPEEER